MAYALSGTPGAHYDVVAQTPAHLLDEALRIAVELRDLHLNGTTPAELEAKLSTALRDLRPDQHDTTGKRPLRQVANTERTGAAVDGAFDDFEREDGAFSGRAPAETRELVSETTWAHDDAVDVHADPEPAPAAEVESAPDAPGRDPLERWKPYPDTDRAELTRMTDLIKACLVLLTIWIEEAEAANGYPDREWIALRAGAALRLKAKHEHWPLVERFVDDWTETVADRLAADPPSKTGTQPYYAPPNESPQHEFWQARCRARALVLAIFAACGLPDLDAALRAEAKQAERRCFAEIRKAAKHEPGIAALRAARTEADVLAVAAMPAPLGGAA
jgi:hypothetical protein